MKKRFATLLLAFAFILPALLLFTACGGKDGFDSAKVTSISVQLTNENYSMSDNTITIPYGSKVSLSASDFKVSADVGEGESVVVSLKTEDEDGFTFTSDIPDADVTPRGEYTLTFACGEQSVGVTVKVVKATIDMSGVSWNYSEPFTYDGVTKTVAVTGLPTGVSVTYEGITSASVPNDYLVTAKFSYVDGENYNAIPDKTLDWKINKGTLAVPQMVQNGEYVYEEGTTHTLAIKTADGSTLPQNISYSISGDATAVNAGDDYEATITFTYSGSDAEYYNPIQTQTIVWEVQKGIFYNVGDLTLEDDSLIYNGTTQTVELVTTGLNTEMVEIAGFTGAEAKDFGSYAVVVNFNYIGADTNYGSVASLRLDWSIAKKSLTIKANDKLTGVTYGDPRANAGVTYSGFVAGEDENTPNIFEGSLAYDYDGYDAGEDAGDYLITPSGLTSRNYDISFESGTLRVARRALTIKANDVTIDYKTNATNHGVEPTGLVNGDVVADLGTVVFKFYKMVGSDEVLYTAGSNVGEYIITPSGLDETNYDITYQNGTLTVEKIDVDVDLTTIELEDDVLTYNGLDQEGVLAVKESTLPSGVTVTGIIVRDAEAIEYGSYTAVIYLQYVDTTNYNPMEEIELPFTIEKATVQPTAFDDVRIVGSADFVGGAYVYGGYVRHVSVDGVPAGAKCILISGYEGVAVGNYTLTVRFECSDTKNYNTFDAVTKTFQWAITPATLIVKANDKEITFGDDADPNGYGYEVVSGLKMGEKAEDVIKGTPVYTYNYTKGNNTGEYTISISGLSADNYTIQLQNGTLSVVAKVVDVSNINWSGVEDEYTYTGSAIKPEIEGIPVGVKAVYTYSVTNPTVAGHYTVSVVLSAENDNYELVGNNGVADFEFVIKKAKIDLTGVQWNIPNDGVYYYTGEALEVELNRESDDLIQFEYTYMTTGMTGIPVQEAVELGDYQVVVSLIYDDENYELENQSFLLSQPFSIQKQRIQTSAFSWNGSETPTLESSYIGNMHYSVSLAYRNSGYVYEIQGENLDKLNITYSYNEYAGSTAPTVVYGGDNYLVANIELKEEYADIYEMEASPITLSLEIEIEHRPFKNLALNGEEITLWELNNLQHIKIGSQVTFELNDGYVMKGDDNSVATSPINFDKVDWVNYSVYCGEQWVGSFHTETYAVEGITVNGDQEISYPVNDHISVRLAQGQTSLPISISGRLDGVTLKYTYGNSDYITITGNSFTISDLTDVSTVVIYVQDLSDSESYSQLLWMTIEEYDPIARYVFNAVSFDGETTEVEVDGYWYSNMIYTGFFAVDANDSDIIYTNTKIYTDETRTTEVDLTDINSYAGNNVYLAVFDDESNFISGKTYSIHYEFIDANVNRVSTESMYTSEVFMVEDASSYLLNYNVENDNITVVATINGGTSIDLTADVTYAEYKIQITVGEKAYTFTREIRFVKTCNVFEVFDDTESVVIYNESTQLNSDVRNYGDIGSNVRFDLYNASNIRNFETNELSGLEISGLKQGYAVTSKDVFEVNGDFYIKFVLHYTPTSADGGLVEFDKTWIVSVDFMGEYNNNTDATIKVYGMGDPITLDSAVTSIELDITSYEELDVQLSNYYASAVIKNGEEIIARSNDWGRLEFTPSTAGSYTLVIIATDGTTRTYEITVTGEVVPILEVVIGEEPYQQFMGSNGPDNGPFIYTINNEYSYNFKLYIGAEAQELIDENGKFTITSANSSIFAGANVYSTESNITPIGTLPLGMTALTVQDIESDMPYVMFYVMIQMEMGQDPETGDPISETITAYIYIYLCEQPADADVYYLFKVTEGDEELSEGFRMVGEDIVLVGDFAADMEELVFEGYLGNVDYDGTSETFILDSIAVTDFAVSMIEADTIVDKFNSDAVVGSIVPGSVNTFTNLEFKVGSYKETPCISFGFGECVIYLYLTVDPNADNPSLGEGLLPEETTLTITIGSVTKTFADMEFNTDFNAYTVDFTSLNASDLVENDVIPATITTDLTEEFESASTGTVYDITQNIDSEITIECADGLYFIVYDGEVFILFMFGDAVEPEV